MKTLMVERELERASSGETYRGTSITVHDSGPSMGFLRLCGMSGAFA